MRKVSLIGAFGLILALGTLGPAVLAAGSRTDSGSTMMAYPARSCPMDVSNVSVRYEDVDNGGALAFSTKAGDIASLRERVRRMADMYGRRNCGYQDDGPMMMRRERRGGMHGGQGMGSMMGSSPGMMGSSSGWMRAMHRASAEVEQTTNGARLKLTPDDPKDLNGLREHMRWMSRHMSQGNCPQLRAWRAPAESGQSSS